MRYSTIFGGLLLLCVALGSKASFTLPFSEPPDHPRPPPMHLPGVVDPRVRNPNWILIIDYEGRINSITEKTITLQVYFTESALTGGSNVMEPTGRPPRRFKFSAELAAGKIAPKEQLLHGLGYGRDDLRIGDVIVLTVYVLPNGVEEARYINIFSRPGGRVPAHLYEPNITSRSAWHTRMNAYQDFEEHGTPLPKYFDQTGSTTAYLKRRMANIRTVLGQD